ncbi:MAG: hypothetical protein LBK06_09070, partial [Planctomycetaceae bacterium]|nr:hypothetical protein [Planctomycetaceae bacterium]
MKRTKRPPFIFRLMLSLPFLPILILLAYIIFFAIIESDSPLWKDSMLTMGIPTWWFYLFFTTFPFLLGIWIFRSGQWRLPVLVAGTVYYGLFLSATSRYLEEYAEVVEPEKRKIVLYLGSYKNIDVYCNGVHLGQTPLKIRVDELIAKVPEWTSPPEQQRYSDNPEMDYTWFPYDDFRSKERFLEVKKLFTSETRSVSSLAFRKKQSNTYNTNCRYWWRLESNGCLIESSDVQHDCNEPFEKIYAYYINNVILPRSASIHAWLLANVLVELTESEKDDWDRHVLKHWTLIHRQLDEYLTAEIAKYRLNNPNDPRIKKLETAFHSTARLKYGLSNPPTEEECRELMTTWINKSISNVPQDRIFCFDGSSLSGDGYLSNRVSRFKSACIYNDDGFLIDAVTKLIGKTIHKPLVEQFGKNYYRFDDEWAPVIYFAGRDRDVEYFDNFVRYFATTQNGYIELLENQDERVIPLFKTFLYQKTFLDIFADDDLRCELDKDIIASYWMVKNPLLEPVFFEYMSHALSRPKLSEHRRNDLNRVIVKFLLLRIDQKISNNEKSAARIASLQIPQKFKDILIQKIRLQSDRTESDGTKSFSDLLQQAAGSAMFIKTEKTAEDVNRWFTENPDGTLDGFFHTFENDFELGDGIVTKEYRRKMKIIDGIDLSVKEKEWNVGDVVPLYFPDGKFMRADDFQCYLISALLKTNTPETQKTIKQICNKPQGLLTVLSAIAGESLYKTFMDTDPAMQRAEPTSYAGISIDCPDFIFDVLNKLTSDEIINCELTLHSIQPPSLILSYCPSPKAGQLLEKWSQTENEQLKQQLTTYLKRWQKRNEIREHKKELFHKLVNEQITPDNLLTPQQKWI